MVIVAFLVPTVEGVKATVNVALLFAATDVGTEPTTKSVAFVPLETIEEMVKDTVPVF